MGICFFCPNGHPLNVKAELAGKKGYCPTCRVKMRIPLESMRDKDDRVYNGQPTAELIVDGSPKSEERQTGAMKDEEKIDAILGKVTESQRVESLRKPSAPDKIVDLKELIASDCLWFVASGDKTSQYGPVQGAGLLQWIEEMRVGAGTLIRRSDWGDSWVRAMDVLPDEAFKRAGARNGSPAVAGSRDAISRADSEQGGKTYGVDAAVAEGLVNQQRKATIRFYIVCGLLSLTSIAAITMIILLLTRKG